MQRICIPLIYFLVVTNMNYSFFFFKLSCNYMIIIVIDTLNIYDLSYVFMHKRWLIFKGYDFWYKCEGDSLLMRTVCQHVQNKKEFISLNCHWYCFDRFRSTIYFYLFWGWFQICDFWKDNFSQVLFDVKFHVVINFW